VKPNFINSEYIMPLTKHKKLAFVKVLFTFVYLLSLPLTSQTVTVTAPVSSATFCAGTNITVTYTVSSNFSSVGFTNVFTTQLSDAFGSFAAPVTLGTRTAVTGGSSAFLIPFTTATSSNYRVRVVASNPTFTSQSNGVDLRINGLSIGTPTVSANTYCQGELLTFSFSQNCNFSNVGFNNVYSVQLSDAMGSFAAPVTIGTRTAVTAAAITCTVPAAPAGTGYRVRVVSSNPMFTSADNGVDITIIASAGNPTVFGNGTWNVHCFNNFNNYINNYQGFYTEDNLSFNTQTRFIFTISPSSATAGIGGTGNAYQGCPFGNGTLYSVSYKRTNIPCGYYQINIPGHDDWVYIIINSVTVFSHISCCDAHTNAFSGFIQPSDNIEIRYTNGGGPGYLSATFALVNPLVMSAPVTVCAGTNATLTVTNTSSLTLSYSWTPAASISPTTGTVVVATPTSSTIYTVTATDAGCAFFTNTVLITTNPLPTTVISSITSTVLCAGFGNSTLTATGANTYTWSPSLGLNTISGDVVVASPSVNTTYTVSGSNNCAVLNSSRTISVQVIPSLPSTTVAGSGVWNVYCYNGNAFNDYYGYYTENNLSFNTASRWASGSASPSAANGGTMGLAYQGCSIPASNHSTVHRRTNFTCGYYQIDIPWHDDDVSVLINGVTNFVHNGCCDAHVNVWTGFLGPSSVVEIRHRQGGGGSYVSASLTPVPYPTTGSPITICAGGPATISATPFISGVNYSWTPNISLSPTTGSVVTITPTSSIVYTVTASDPATGCNSSASRTVDVNPLPTTSLSPTTGTIGCAAQSRTLFAGGAYTYSWAPSAGLNTTTGNSVIATPTISTTYTVIGNNVCADVAATTTITVVPLIATTVFPPNVWNVYCHNNTTFSNYFGYYTHTGTGPTGYSFNTATQWASGAAPSTATANASGTAYQGCILPTTNISLSFKRTNFTCGTYTITLNSNNDGATLLIDGVQVGTRAGASAVAANFWVGILNVNSQVEIRLTKGAGIATGINVAFTAAAATPSLSTWIGANSSDWFTSSNWCGSGIPSLVTDILIPNSKPQFMPAINAPGAACRNLTISAASAAAGLISALPAASLTISGANSLDVYGNWVNNGVFNAGSGSVNILGATSTSIAGSATETFFNLTINKTGAASVSIPSGIKQIAGSMNFSNGIINQNTTLRFLNGSSTSGANDNSYVNGQVIKVGSQAFTFPLGAGNFYRPISITAPAVTTDNFTAEYLLTDPNPSFTHTSKDASIDHVGRCEYWILNRTGGASNVSVTLTWNATSCGVSDLADLIVARWDAGQASWKDEGNGGTTGNTTTGSIITAAPVTLFSPFTLASKTSTANVLPIELVDFNCSSTDLKNVNINWTTASESNNNYFVIERSLDGFTYEQIARQKGAGNSFTKLYYSYKDLQPVDGISYYRLKQVDFDGKYVYSDICWASNNVGGNIIFYPNPVKNNLTIEGDFSQKSKTNILSVMDLTGKILPLSYTSSDSKITLDCSDLAEGIYFIKVVSGEKEVVRKFAVQK
jgi:hypothetical protein